jgi:hypothetical protein
LLNFGNLKRVLRTILEDEKVEFLEENILLLIEFEMKIVTNIEYGFHLITNHYILTRASHREHMNSLYAFKLILKLPS